MNDYPAKNNAVPGMKDNNSLSEIACIKDAASYMEQQARYLMNPGEREVMQSHAQKLSEYHKKMCGAKDDTEEGMTEGNASPAPSMQENEGMSDNMKSMIFEQLNNTQRRLEALKV